MAKSEQISELSGRVERLQTVLQLREMVRRLWNLEIEFSGTDQKFTEEIRNGTRPEGGLFQSSSNGSEYLALPIRRAGKPIGTIFCGGFLTHPNPAAELSEMPILAPLQLDYLTKMLGFGVEDVQRYLEEIDHAEARASVLLGNSMHEYGSHVIVGRSPVMQSLYLLLDKLRESDSTVLIQGENGTGKENVAKAIHWMSVRREKPFVSQNCSAFNDNLLDSELFGHVRGSFTGAVRDKKGLFEMADGGTFFMDEIGDMSPVLQVKVLRVIQEGTFIPVGGTEARKVNVRIIAATNKELRKMVDRGEFREDLYYRINVINIRVPPLRERREDIPDLVDYFLKKHARTAQEKTKEMSPEALDALMAYNWPGNVRQLENEVQRAIVLSGRSRLIDREMLSGNVTSAAAEMAQVKITGKLRDAMEHVERQIILEGLRRARWNRSKLSKELGISRATLIWKIQKYGLAPDPRT